MATKETHRALVLTDHSEPIRVHHIPKPVAGPGSVVAQVLRTGLLPYSKQIYTGTRVGVYAFPTPMVPGFGGIGRIDTIGPDTTTLKPGQLVYLDVFAHGRDDPDKNMMIGYHGGMTEGSRKLASGEWKDGSFAEFVKNPLENTFALDEKRLLEKPSEGGLGYSLDDLPYIGILSVGYGGLRDLELKAGETIIIAPATGCFGGAAVQVALSMGARVIAVGRNVEQLKMWEKLGEGRVKTVQLANDVEKDTEALQKFGVLDAFLDFSPHVAKESTHIKSCIMALRTKGRVSFMGGIQDDVKVPYNIIYRRSLRLSGRWMYERDHIVDLLKMVHVGVLKLGETAGHKVMGKYPLEEWDAAVDAAAQHQGWGRQVLLTP